MKSKKFLIPLLSGLVLSLSFTAFSFKKEFSRAPLPHLGKVQAFTLQDAQGQAFASNSLNGKIWLASFFFTTCGDVCPRMTKNLSALSRTFNQVDGISLVSITVNPEYDSPEVLSRYAQQFKGRHSNWHFLTGSRTAIQEIMTKSFKVGDASEPIFHSTHFPLVDSKGNIRGYYDGTNPKEINQLYKDAVSLMKETSP